MIMTVRSTDAKFLFPIFFSAREKGHRLSDDIIHSSLMNSSEERLSFVETMILFRPLCACLSMVFRQQHDFIIRLANQV